MKTLKFGLIATWLITAVPAPLLAADMDDAWVGYVLVDKLERRYRDDAQDLLAWEAQGVLASDYHKVALVTSGEYLLDDEETESAEVQLLYRRMISDFFDAQIGLRHDVEPQPTRNYAVLGINGLAPQWFELDANLYLSDRGDVSLGVEAEYDWLLTQRLMLSGIVESSVAFTDDEAVGVGSGLNDIELGLRLGYELRREIRPYLGVVWERKFGQTGDLAEAEGEDREDIMLTAGVKLVF